MLLLNTACALLALVVSGMNIVSHLKNYRNPMAQRLIVRILILVPLFAIASWTNLYAPSVGAVVTPIREMYEALTIYTFYSLLTTLLGGERDIIFTCTGRQPLQLIAPLSFVRKNVDISDPPTFLIIKRAVMQYVWMRIVVTLLRPLLGGPAQIVLTVAYNVSITLALNSLTLFWVCLASDLAPYRPWPKFLCVKLIVFFSYWQTLGLSILHWLGAIGQKQSLSLISNTLLCFETLIFAFYHIRGFPASDYSSRPELPRLTFGAALKDVFGGRDLVHDFRKTFIDAQYGYHDFDSVEAVLDHPESASRQARLAAGLRYKNQGRSKYWIPVNAEVPKPQNYGSIVPVFDNEQEISWSDDDLDGDEAIYEIARQTYGDYNYPVVTEREEVEYRTVAEQWSS